MDMYNNSKKYHTTINNLKKTIDKYGCAIIPNVFTHEECDKLYSEMWDFFEHLTKSWDKPLNRDKQETWKEFYSLFPLHSMLIQYFGIGQSQFAWNARQNEKAIDIFVKLWKCNKEDLLVSFDGSSFHLPPEITNRGWHHGHTWYHTDQSYTRNNFECIQSFVTLRDINKGDGTFTFMEGSNNFHADFAKHYNITDKKDWYKLTESEEQFYINKGCEYKKVTCPKGGMVFWDSRTIHCGVEPIKERKEMNIRAVIYLCYMPRNCITSANLKKKQKAFEEIRTTNHYPCKPKLFGKSPRTYGSELKPITPINPPVLTDLGKRLAGFD